jgi:hypothetical protein
MLSILKKQTGRSKCHSLKCLYTLQIMVFKYVAILMSTGEERGWQAGCPFPMTFYIYLRGRKTDSYLSSYIHIASNSK